MTASVVAHDEGGAGRALHARLLAGDPVAPADLAETYLDSLVRWLRMEYPTVDPHMWEDAAGDAILSLIKAPSTYKPDRLSLESYLRMSARGDLLNILRKEVRHSRRRVDLETVELSPWAGKYVHDGDADPMRILVKREETDEMMRARVPAVPMTVQQGLTPEESGVLTLMRQGERKTALYAQALGITHVPFAVQQREVKRVKDRLNKRLQRAGSEDGP